MRALASTPSGSVRRARTPGTSTTAASAPASPKLALGAAHRARRLCPSSSSKRRARGRPREDRAHRRPHGLRRVGVGAARARAPPGVRERVRRADDRAHVARVLHAVQIDEQIARRAPPSAACRRRSPACRSRACSPRRAARAPRRSPARRTNSGPPPRRPRPGPRPRPRTGRASSRQRFCWSLRIVLSLSLSGDVITEQKGRLVRGARERFGSAVALSGRGLPGFLGKTSERLGVAHGDVRQHLAVELDAGLLQAVHELAVATCPPGGRRR